MTLFCSRVTGEGQAELLSASDVYYEESQSSLPEHQILNLEVSIASAAHPM